MRLEPWSPSHFSAGSEDGHLGLRLEVARGQGPQFHPCPVSLWYATQFTRGSVPSSAPHDGPWLQRTYCVPTQGVLAWWHPSSDDVKGGV